MVGIIGALAAGVAGGAGVGIVISAVDNFSKTFTKAKLGVAGFAKMGGVAIIAGAALAGGMVLLAKKASEVETGFAKVNTLLEDGQDAQEIFGKTVKELNINMGNQGDQLSVLEGLYQTISAGITDTTEAQEFMNKASIAAVGGSAELSTVILAGTKALAAYGMDVSETGRLMDLFAGTVKAGQTTMGDLAQAFPTVAGMAAEAGVSIEETLGTFAGLTKVLAGTEETATSLSAVIRAFIKPSKDMQLAAKDLGYENAVMMIKTEGLNESLRILNTSVDGDTEAMAKLFPNVRALKAVYPMLGTAAEDVAASIDIVTNSTGLSDKQYQDLSETMEFQWGVAMSEAQNGMVDLGNVMKEILMPALKFLTSVIKVLVNWWSNLSEGQKKLVGVIIGVIAILAIVTGAVLLMSAAVGVLTAISLPLVLIILAIIAAVAVAILIYKNWDKITKALGKTWQWLKDRVFIPVWNTMKSMAKWIKDTFLRVIGKVISKIKSVIKLAKKAGGKVASAARKILGSRQMGGYIPQTGLYNLHKGEYVVPKLPSGGGSSKGGITIQINNLNGFNARDIARTLQRELATRVSIA